MYSEVRNGPTQRMTLPRSLLGGSVGALALAVVLATVVPASADISASTPAPSQKTALCRAVFDAAEISEPAAASVGRALETANFTAAKKQLLFYFGSLAKREQKAVSLLNGAPSKVQAAAAVDVKEVDNVEALIRRSTSGNELESSSTLQAEQGRVESAESTLSAYHVSECGSPIR
jgi:hypothetical protein